MTTPDMILLALVALGLAFSFYNSWQLRKTDREIRDEMKRRYPARGWFAH